MRFFTDTKKGNDVRGHHGHAGAFRGRRAKHWAARMWLYENPAPEDIIKMLEEYQRDLEQEVESVAQRIAELKQAQNA